MQHRKLRRRRIRGNALMEFVFVGIPLLFIFISIEEMSRGMWQYHSLQYAVKLANSYATVHGATCATSPNTCTVTAGNVITVFENAAFGIPMSQVSVTLTSENNSVTCSQVSTCSTSSSWSSQWPPSANSDNEVGNWIEFRANYTFNTALAMFWTGKKTFSFGSSNGNGQFVFPGYSYQVIQF